MDCALLRQARGNPSISPRIENFPRGIFPPPAFHRGDDALFSPRRAFIALALLPVAASARDALKPLEGELQPLVVTGKAENLLARPFVRRGELLEVVPGMVVTQHPGGGKLNQYFVRGYNLDHGTDFGIFIDGMKGLLQRFTQWFNRGHSRSGTLWEDRFKSVIVEDGVAARTMSAYIDLNPVRAGMVKDPADYRWSSYGESVDGGKKGNGKKARERFGQKRKDGARKLKGEGSATDGKLWSLRDLRKGIV